MKIKREDKTREDKAREDRRHTEELARIAGKIYFLHIFINFCAYKQPEKKMICILSFNEFPLSQS